MSDAVIAATFSDLKLIRGRKVCQLVFEIPVEQAQAATAALGFPHSETWCAIARLNKTSGPCPTRGPEQAAGDRALDAAPAAPKPNSTRAVMMAKDVAFQRYTQSADEAEADKAIKLFCRVDSKAELNAPPASMMFERLRHDFNVWRLANQ